MAVGTVATKPRWETRDYVTITAAGFTNGWIVVQFADGSEVRLLPDQFDNPYIRSQAPDWSRVTVGPHEIIAPGRTEAVGIPWDSLRALTDPEYRAHWEDLVAESRRRFGARVKELREQRNLTLVDLAGRTATAVDLLARIEAGDEYADLDRDERILAAMGCSFDDLIATA